MVLNLSRALMYFLSDFTLNNYFFFFLEPLKIESLFRIRKEINFQYVSKNDNNYSHLYQENKINLIPLNFIINPTGEKPINSFL